MENNLQVFKNEEFGEIRTITINSEPWFVGKDIAEKLGYAKPQNAVSTHVDEDDTLKQGITDNLGRTQQTTIINESGLYSLILRSKLSSAKKFKRWVTNEVLPSIRKTGGYINVDNNMSDSEIMARALQVAQKTIAMKDKMIEEHKPKVLFASAVESSETSILVRELAKLLNQNGIDIGQQRLFEWLRENGYLIKKKGTDWNTPSQYSMDLKLMELKESITTHNDGHITITRTSKITGKGQLYFLNKFLKKSYIGANKNE